MSQRMIPISPPEWKGLWLIQTERGADVFYQHENPRTGKIETRKEWRHGKVLRKFMGGYSDTDGVALTFASYDECNAFIEELEGHGASGVKPLEFNAGKVPFAPLPTPEQLEAQAVVAQLEAVTPGEFDATATPIENDVNRTEVTLTIAQPELSPNLDEPIIVEPEAPAPKKKGRPRKAKPVTE